MKRVLLLAVASCVPESTPEWQLDHDRILAVRAEPPALAPGEIGHVEVLVAHAGGGVTVELPQTMSAPNSPLFTAVHFNIDHYQIDGPDEMQLADARAELGLPDGAPVPLDIELRVGGPLYAKKRVLLGIAGGNPALPAATVPPMAAAHSAVPLLIEASNAHWFTSCGEMRDEREVSATLVTGDACDGEVVVVVREGEVGVVWGIWPIRVR